VFQEALGEFIAAMVFTIKTSVYGPYGVCNTEQDVLVTEDGLVPLLTSQDEVIGIG
jgi:Xaa-Pro aminopeptidase